ncbi:hypothetical protein [Actinomadura atramentaria]|uniref:hypothetical protein n=1 Tax=Actinomadura atramentaria TaxID=1990 RepID=UPI0003701EDB|nr:hypothetical protein [Actinomadura atramentaria]
MTNDNDPAPLAAVLDRALRRIDRAFAEDADRHESDKHSALEDIEAELSRARRELLGEVATSDGE